MKLNTIYNEDLFDTMERMVNDGIKVDCILTSPPYNTGRNIINSKDISKSMKRHEVRYDVYLERRDVDEYCQWTSNIFDVYDSILSENGCILYNMSYGSENPSQMYLVLAKILENTNFMVADTIVWKKKSALPNNVSPNKLTRIYEFVFVLCRKSEFNTFKTNKKVVSVRENGQKMYQNIYNFIEAKNNDGPNHLNKATFSSELCEKLLEIYATPSSIIYDSFMGTGTTAVACKRLGHTFIGSEISSEQCKFANDRLEQVQCVNDCQQP